MGTNSEFSPCKKIVEDIFHGFPRHTGFDPAFFHKVTLTWQYGCYLRTCHGNFGTNVQNHKSCPLDHNPPLLPVCLPLPPYHFLIYLSTSPFLFLYPLWVEHACHCSSIAFMQFLVMLANGWLVWRELLFSMFISNVCQPSANQNQFTDGSGWGYLI